jgi:hypothetical protein
MDLRFAICDLRFGKRAIFLTSAIALVILSAPLGAFAAPSTSDETAYTQTINKRADDIIAALDISDSSKSENVHDILVAQYRAIRDWHDANDAKLKQADKDQATAARESLKTLHDQFIAKLSSELTSEQVEKVKDKMTYGKVKVTYDAYVQIIGNLTSEEKTKVLELLKDAREEAMDGGSAEEKSAIFKKYKGRINNYLTAQGHDVNKAYKDWGAKQKASTQP